jgi:hypothetical protein
MRTIQLSLVFLLLLGCNPGGNDIPQNATQKSKQDQRLSIGAPKVIPKKQQRPTNQPIDFAFVWKKNSGIDFKHGSGFDDQRVFPAANGSGIGIFDFDLDSLADAYFASGKHFPVGKPTQDSLNQLYRNLGNWEFDNGSVESSTAIDAYCSGVTIGDFDNDGFQDIYVGCYGPNLLIQNMGALPSHREKECPTASLCVLRISIRQSRTRPVGRRVVRFLITTMMGISISTSGIMGSGICNSKTTVVARLKVNHDFAAPRQSDPNRMSCTKATVMGPSKTCLKNRESTLTFRGKVTQRCERTTVPKVWW